MTAERALSDYPDALETAAERVLTSAPNAPVIADDTQPYLADEDD